MVVEKPSDCMHTSKEAEYIASADCCKEAFYLRSLLRDLTEYRYQIELNVGNQSAIAAMKLGILNKRRKHINVRYHFIHKTFLKIKYL